MKTIGGKLFIGFLCMAALTIGLLWLIQAGIMKDSYINERVGKIQSTLKQASGESDIDFTSLEENLNAHFILLDKDGSTSYVSQSMPMMGRMMRRQMMPEANGQLQTMSGMNDESQYAVIGYKMASGGTLYAVFSLTDVQEASRILQKQLWIVTIALIGFSIVLAVVLARKFSRPIRRVTEAARTLAQGKLDISLPLQSQDEIGQLTLALNDLGEQLKMTDRLRKELIASVSHELRAPLTVIQGYAETVRDVTWPNTDKRSRQLTIIADEAARLNRMVTDMLDYARLQAGAEKMNPTDFSVLSVLEKMSKLHELDAAARGMKITLDCPELTICFDKNRFEQVINNLLNNALKFAEPSTDIGIRAEKKSAMARISIRNKGDNIPKEEIDRIWDKYYRSEQNRTQQPGTGFGLSIVKSILEAHGVPFGVVSEKGETIFWFEAKIAG